MWYWGDFGGWWVPLMMIFMVIFWGAIIALVVWAVRRMTHRETPSGGTSPLDIAKERYAKGEITREQFEQMKKDL